MRDLLDKLRLSCGGAMVAVLLGHVTGLTPHGGYAEWFAALTGFVLAFWWLHGEQRA